VSLFPPPQSAVQVSMSMNLPLRCAGCV